MTRTLTLLMVLQAGIVVNAQNQIRFPGTSTGGTSTGAANVPPGLEVQLAQQGTKLADMDTNINRRLDELRTKLDDVGRSTESLKPDVAKLSVVSNIFTFGVSSLVTIMFTVVLAVPMTFLVQHFLRKKFPQ